jgi:magnesium-transporting ATPase (P-type)
VPNAALGYAQELQAERASEALRELLPVRARVREDGTELQVPAARSGLRCALRNRLLAD